MSKGKLINDKKRVDEYIEEKMISYAETVEAEDGLPFLQYMIDMGIADDFSNAPFNIKRVSIDNYEVYPMIYALNILTGEWSTRRTKAILKNEAILQIMGFSDEAIKNGITKRGKGNQHGKGYERTAGVMASTTVIDNLARFSYEGLVECFNKFIKRVSKLRIIDLGDTYILDSTIVETSKDYPGAGKTKRKDEEGEEKDEVIWGFKVFVLSSAKTKIPVAIHIVPANEADAPMYVKMVKKGIENVGIGKIKIVLADRGFLDGSQLYELKYRMHIDFVIPAKKNMAIYKCFVGLKEDNTKNIEEWRYGRKGMSGGYLSKGSVSYAQYADESAGHDKNKNGEPINGVVVTKWRNQDIEPGKEKVILTSLDTDSAIEVIQLYGQRSLIENCNFRELKQAVALKQLPQFKDKNTKITAYIHMLLCVFTLGIFIVMVETVYSNPEYAEKKIPKNLREFQFMNKCEKGKIFVLVKNYYHIYDMEEFLILAGFTIVPRE